MEQNNVTPWRRVYSIFGLSQAELARHLDRHRSKISRALRDDRGLINGADQVRLMKAARKLNVQLSKEDLTNV